MDDRDEDVDSPGVVEVVGNEVDVSAEPSVRKGVAAVSVISLCRRLFRRGWAVCVLRLGLRSFRTRGVCFEDESFVSSVGFPSILQACFVPRERNLFPPLLFPRSLPWEAHAGGVALSWD